MQSPDEAGTPYDVLIDQAQAKLEALADAETILAKGGRQLVALDLTHDRAQAVIAVGNIDTADHVSVFTPGFTTTTEKMIDADQKMYDLTDRARQLLRDDPASQGQSAAGVVWLGYQAPQWDTLMSTDNSVVMSGTAEQGGRDLAAFLTGISTSRSDQVDLIAIGHSYGSSTTGYAMQNLDPGVVDRAVFYGSPGLGTEDLNDLALPRKDLYVLEAPKDPVADLGPFGGDPNQKDLNTLETRAATAPDGTPMKGVTGHSDYLNPETTSQYNVATVVTGQTDFAIPGNPQGVGDALRDIVDKSIFHPFGFWEK